MITQSCCTIIFRKNKFRFKNKLGIAKTDYLKLKKLVIFLSFFICANFFSQILSSNLEKKTLALGEVNRFTVRIDNLNNQEVKAAPKDELLPLYI